MHWLAISLEHESHSFLSCSWSAKRCQQEQDVCLQGCRLENVLLLWQGTAQGALFGILALSQGVGPLVFAFLFSGFTRSDSTWIYFPGSFAHSDLLLDLKIKEYAVTDRTTRFVRYYACSEGMTYKNLKKIFDAGAPYLFGAVLMALCTLMAFTIEPQIEKPQLQEPVLGIPVGKAQCQQAQCRKTMTSLLWAITCLDHTQFPPPAHQNNQKPFCCLPAFQDIDVWHAMISSTSVLGNQERLKSLKQTFTTDASSALCNRE